MGVFILRNELSLQTIMSVISVEPFSEFDQIYFAFMILPFKAKWVCLVLFKIT
jgi:hypothetical protein